jgi:O-antigen ligase
MAGKPIPVIGSGRDRTALPRAVPTDSYLFMRVLLISFLIVTLDFTKFLDKGNAARYLILAVPFCGALAIRFRSRTGLVRKASFADKLLLVLMLFGGIGSIYGRIHLHTSTTALPIFLPMPIAFLYLLMLDEPTEEEVRKVLFAVGAIGLLYVFLNAVANSGLSPSLKASRTYRNAEFMYVAMGFAALVVTKRWRRVIVFSLLTVVVLVTYPSATSALVVLVTIVTFFATRPQGTRARFYVAGIITLLLIVIALFNFSRTIKLADDYFSAVGKKNNSTARLALWEVGMQKFVASPFIGDAFSDETTVTVYRQTGYGAAFHNPYNNDYVLFLASGGALGFLLLIAWIVWVERVGMQRYRGFVASGQSQHAALMRVLLVAFNAWLTAAAFNPLFTGMGRSVTLFSLYALMMALGRPAIGAQSQRVLPDERLGAADQRLVRQAEPAPVRGPT